MPDKTEEFFDEPREQSLVKSRIVAKYFWAWAKVIIPFVKTGDKRLLYMDLFAGPGRYNDGTPSTPITVLETAIKEPDLRGMLVTFFNDKDKGNAARLQNEVDAIRGVETLRYRPQIESEEVGERIAQRLDAIKLIPTLLFVDPWGYKGLSLVLINSVLKNWGSDCIFFFNYNRINPGLNNEAVRERMDDVFGRERAATIRQRLAGLEPQEREILIVEEMSEAVKKLGAAYVLPFTFKNERGTRTTQHLIFASKNFRGYEIMKEIMAKESSEQDQGVPSFTYSPASEKYPLLFELSRPLDDLEEMLLERFAGVCLTMQQIYERHNVDRNYIKANYKKVLAKMEASGKIKATPAANRRRKIQGETTFGDDVMVTFPTKAENELSVLH